MQLEVSLGKVKTKISYNNESELPLINSIVKELNVSCNKILSNLEGNIDDIVLLSFLLFDTGFKLYNSLQRTQEDNMVLFLKSINRYIQLQTKNNMSDGEKLEEVEKLKEMLVVANIAKRIEFKTKNTTNDDDMTALINNFGNDIKNYIKNIENTIVLY